MKLHFPETIDAHLTFTTPQESPSKDDPLVLPSIFAYLPEGTDHASANALQALYKTHCICIIDAFRFCKERLFFKHYSSFNGTMTVPVQKLLGQPSLAPWIEECDTKMYQKMIAYVDPLITQMVPNVVTETFKRIVTKLTKHIFDSFEKQPRHVVQAKIFPATRFVHLLSRLPKVNAAAQTANNWLSVPETRYQMWGEFVKIIDAQKLLEDAQIPSEGKTAALNILKYDVRSLLTPLVEQIQDFEAGTFWEDADQTNHSHSHAIPPISTMDEVSHFLDRWISWLMALPANFPNHAAKCIINFPNSFWRGVLSELGINGAASFQAWWVVESFLSCMILWQTEKAGFMSLGTIRETSRRYDPPPQMVEDEFSTGYSRPQTARTESIGRTGSAFDAGSDRRDGLPALDTKQHYRQQLQLHDDSGISLGVDDEVDAGKKWRDITASDPADAEGDIIVR